MSTYYIETYGCQMNTAESNAIEALLKGAFWTPAEMPEEADLAIINTCSVRKSAENRIWGRLGFYKSIKAHRKQFLVLTGCMASRIGDEIKKDNPFIDLVLPVNDKLKILERFGGGDAKRADSIIPNSDIYEFTSSYYKEGDYSSFVPIMNGCNNFCSYCIVPYVRGREVSRPVDDIMREVAFLDSKGVCEITLLGQNVNSYNYNGVKFPSLLKSIAGVCRNIEWIRFESPHPKDFSDELISVIRDEKRVAKHLHIPMQSGSTRVLERMNRRYTKEGYLELISKIKREVPGITFAVDVMTGFPGETQEDFEETLAVMREVGYIEAYMYYYNPREGTRSVMMDGQIEEKERQRRLAVLIEKQLAWAAEIKEKRAGGVNRTLVTGVSRDDKNRLLGRNEHNEMVAFTPKDCSGGNGLQSSKIGTFVDVEFLYLNGNTFVGREV